MRWLASRYRGQPVLIVGDDDCVRVARRDYGLDGAMGITEVQTLRPDLVPYKKYRWKESSSGGLKRGVGVPFACGHLPAFKAVFVFEKFATDAFNDVQVILDVLLSPSGQPGTMQVGRRQSVPLYMSADDFMWAAAPTALPRLGQGALREMLCAVYRCATGGEELEITQYGKPRRVALTYAAMVLREESQRLRLGGEFGGSSPATATTMTAGGSTHTSVDDQPPRHLGTHCGGGGGGAGAGGFRTLCMVGDNPETDIAGANAMGPPWLSVQVLTGVVSASTSSMSAATKPFRLPTALRTVSPGDVEGQWLETHQRALSTPHYVAPSLDHFVRELQYFSEAQITSSVAATGSQVVGELCPVDLRGAYNVPMSAL